MPIPAPSSPFFPARQGQAHLEHVGAQGRVVDAEKLRSASRPHELIAGLLKDTPDIPLFQLSQRGPAVLG